MNDLQSGQTHLPRPAIQCTAMQPFGSSLKRLRNISKNSSITSTGGPMPSSNGKSFSHNKINIKLMQYGMFKKQFRNESVTKQQRHQLTENGTS